MIRVELKLKLENAKLLQGRAYQVSKEGSNTYYYLEKALISIVQKAAQPHPAELLLEQSRVDF